MSRAVNQRVFDVPACGAFLLTDYQESLDELFEIGKELVVYRHKDEIPEIVRYYLKNPEQRKTIAMKGRQRVLKEHTYKHRLNELINYMKDRYK
jgi:spore maturation protein CgeB